MKRICNFILLVFCAAAILPACARKAVADTVTVYQQGEDINEEITIFAEPVDQQLDLILEEIHENVSPDMQKDSLSAAAYCVSLINWCETTDMMDDEILYLVLIYMSELPGEEYSLFQSQMELLFRVQKELSIESSEALLGSAGVSTQTTWSSMAVQHFNSIMDAAGVDVYNYPFAFQ